MKAFFCSKGKFNPVYFWVTALLILIISVVIMRIFGKGSFSDTLILGLCGFVVAWLGLYDYNKRKSND